MSMVIAPSEWNSLTLEEKRKRTDEFTAHLRALPPQAPVDWSYLTALAIMYKTPVPKYVSGQLDWGEYRQRREAAVI